MDWKELGHEGSGTAFVRTKNTHRCLQDTRLLVAQDLGTYPYQQAERMYALLVPGTFDHSR